MCIYDYFKILCFIFEVIGLVKCVFVEGMVVYIFFNVWYFILFNFVLVFFMF